MLCHFSTAELRSHLPLSSNKLFNKLLKMLGKPVWDYYDYAPWNADAMADFEKEKDIELHIIMPHLGLKDWKYEFEHNGVSYHVYRPQPLYPWYYLERILCRKQYETYPRSRKIVKEWIDKIKPDIVNLVGAENPYYSICGLDVENTPMIITCQTIYSNPDRYTFSGNVSRYLWDLEQKLFAKTKYFACTNTKYRELIQKSVPDANVFPWVYSDSPFPKLDTTEKKYDFAFFSINVTAKKGIDSAIEALGIVKKKKKDVTLLVVGNLDGAYREELLARIKDLELEGNIIFHEFFPLQLDMLNYVRQARFALLPVKMDHISCTILQALEMGMPVVTHITSGTPSINKERETVLLSEIGDIQTTADNMLKLMNEPELAKELAENGMLYMQKRHEKASRSVAQRIEQYKAVIENYRNGTPIPEEMLEIDN